MSSGEVESMEAAIIRHTSQYGHIENILHILEQYQRTMTHAEAITRLHAEVVEK